MTTASKRRFPVWAIVLITFLVTVLLTVLVIRYYFWPSPFQPTELSAKEEQRLEQKLQRVIPGFAFSDSAASDSNTDGAGGRVEPTPYSEEGLDRNIAFSERELNALLAKNTDFGDQLAVDLSNNLLSATLLVPVDPDFPILGGKTVRVKSGMGLEFQGDRLVAQLKGVTVMGVPLPNDWLGGLKNVDLVQQFGDQGGFWSAFAGGIKHLAVQDGEIQIELAE